MVRGVSPQPGCSPSIDSMRVLILQPDEYESAGSIGEALVAGGASLDHFVIQSDFTSPPGDVDFPDLSEHDVIVVMGSPWSVYDERIEGWVQPLLAHLRKAVETDVPVLGICFGAQALSAAFGGKVERAGETEFGWYELESESSLLRGPWFEFHHDVFSVPTGAEELARTSAGPQVFRLGRSLAVQFHPELGPELLEKWYQSGDEGRLQRSGLDTVSVMEQTKAFESESADRAARLVGWFLGDFVGEPTRSD